ncbi:hypothetical protein [Xanthobacter autotrophicus]|uniref:hypothetical protein n=1 Tax=Xanthobacter autotrophicus TaxID=280 RepID=UPI0024A658DE|nr:hypothetical protein [Xanthobacter autotrophicus]MDI4658143.1 hypothetical protein [Xanthobacter autotrophicus]
MRGYEAEAVPEVRAHRPFVFSANRSRTLVRLAGLALCMALGACQTDGSGMASSGNRALAFDTIDGPPPATFDKLVGQLSSEAQDRKVSVVSRSTSAAYRVKGYLALHVDKGKATVAYAWDVYDQNQTRVARIAGEEPAGKVKGGLANGWAACDDAVLSRVANRSMASLAETLGVGGSAQAVSEPAPGAAASAAASSGLGESPAAEPAPRDPSGVPVAALSAPSAALAYADN